MCPLSPHITQRWIGLLSLSWVGKPLWAYQQLMPRGHTPVLSQASHGFAHEEVVAENLTPSLVIKFAVGVVVVVCSAAPAPLAAAARLFSAAFSPFSLARCVSVKGKETLMELVPRRTKAASSPSAKVLMACSPS